MTRSIFSKLFFTCFYSSVACMALVPGQVHASLVGDSINVDFPNDPNATTDVITVVGGPELTPDGTSFISSNFLIEGEFIDVGESSIVYRVSTNGSGEITTVGGVDYTNAGYISGDRFVFSGFDFSGIPDAILTGVTVFLNDVIRVELGTDVFFTPDSVTLNLDRMLIRSTDTTVPEFGTITLNLQFETATPVPLPGSLMLLTSGLAFLSFSMISRRKIARAV